MEADHAPSSATATADIFWAVAALVLLTGLGVGCWLAYDPLAVTNDATQSLSVARHLARGDGIRTSIIYYEEQYATGEVPAPQTVFPPGYPGLVAAVSLLGIPIVPAAYLVVSVGFLAVAFLMLLTARRMGLSLTMALLLTLAWCSCVRCWELMRGCMSEMPFIALTLLSLLLFPDDAVTSTTASSTSHADAAPGRRTWWLVFLSGCAAAAAFTVRYAGVFWFITVAAFYAVSLRRQFGRNLRSALTWGAVPIITVSILFWRNQRLSGEWTGGNAIGTQHSWLVTLKKIYYSASALFGWSWSRLTDGGAAEWLLIAALVGLVGWLIVFRRNLRIDRRRIAVMTQQNRVLLCCGYVLTTLCLLIVLDTRSPIGLGPRKLVPIVPFALLGAGMFLSVLHVASERASRMLLVPGGLFLAALVAGQVKIAEYVRSEPPVMAMINAALQSSDGDQTLQQELQSEITAEAPLMTNEPQRVGHLIERPVVGLASPEYTDRLWTEPEVRQFARSYGVRRVTVFADALAIAGFRPPFFEELAAGNVPDWLKPPTTFDGGNVLSFEVVTPAVIDRSTIGGEK